jgi:hypothetical protein
VEESVLPEAGSRSPGIPAADWTGIELRHAIPGRVRLRFPGIKGQPVLAREIQQQLAGLPVVRRVEVSAVTGSVLVVYDPADSAAIAGLGRLMIPGLNLDGMADSGPRTGAESDPTAAPAAAVAEFARRLNDHVEAVTGSADLRFLVPASLFVGGLIRLIASKKLTSPAWYDFLWFAFGTYCTLNRSPAPEGPDPPLAGEGVDQDNAMPARARSPRTGTVPDR